MPSPDTRSRVYYDAGRQGFVYVLRSPLLRTEDGTPLLKIGATRKHPLTRVKELSAGTGVPEGYTLAYYRDYADAFLAESLTHEQFAAARLNESREFFAAPLAAVIAFLDGLPNSSHYRELVSEGVVGGEDVDTEDYGPEEETPFADLFATFPDDGQPRELTAEEQAKCRALEKTQ